MAKKMENKTAHWIKYRWNFFECSNCHNEGSVIPDHKSKYCPDCGFIMNEKIEEKYFKENNMWNYKSKYIENVQNEWENLKIEYRNKMEAAFEKELAECGFADKDVVCLANNNNKVGRIIFKRDVSNFDIEYKYRFAPYTKKGELSQVSSEIICFDKLTDVFRLAEGNEIVNPNP